MRKERKIKTRQHEKKTLYIIFGSLAIALGTILALNARSSFKKIETQNCVRNMALMEEAMRQMKKEFRFDVPPNISFDDLAEMMAYYFHFGKVVFENPTTGTLRLKPKSQLVNLKLTKRRHRYILEFPKCPSKGHYTLIPSKIRPGLFDIQCSVHGRLYQADKHNKYAFTGDIDALNPRQSALGREADLYFFQGETPKGFVTVIPYAQPEPSPTPKPPQGAAK